MWSFKNSFEAMISWISVTIFRKTTYQIIDIFLSMLTFANSVWTMPSGKVPLRTFGSCPECGLAFTFVMGFFLRILYLCTKICIELHSHKYVNKNKEYLFILISIMLFNFLKPGGGVGFLIWAESSRWVVAKLTYPPKLLTFLFFLCLSQ